MLWYDASHCDDSSFCNYSTCPKFFVVLSCIRTQTRNRLLSWIWNTGIAWTAMSPGSTVYWPRVAGWSRLCTYWHKDMSFFNRRFQYFKSVVRSMTRQPLSFSTFFKRNESLEAFQVPSSLRLSLLILEHWKNPNFWVLYISIAGSSAPVQSDAVRLLKWILDPGSA